MKRYDFVYLFDVTDGNPNGDPDAGNLPRVDPETGHGLVTDVCLKRKVRNYVSLTKSDNNGFGIFVQERSILNVKIDEGYKKSGHDPEKAKEKEKKKDKSQPRRDEIASVRATMCQMFYDIRAFGAVLSTGANAGQVRGPVQLTFSRSINPVIASEHALTRVAVTSEKDAKTKETEFGRKFTLPYGLYRCHGFINPFLARQTGFGEEDLTLFWKALENAFEFDRSAARGQMAARVLIVFEHGSPLGNGHAHQLQSRVKVTTNKTDQPIRRFEDYDIEVDDKELPDGITIKRLF